MIEAMLKNGKPLYSYKHINAVSLPETPTYTVMAGQTEVGDNVVFYYDKGQRYMGWSYMSSKVKFDPFPKAADFSILSPDMETILKVGFNEGLDATGKIIALADCAGGVMTAPCMIVLRYTEGRPFERAYSVHYWNEEISSYFEGCYDMTMERAMILFMEKAEKERQSAKDQGLPPTRVLFQKHWGIDGDMNQNQSLRRWKE